MIRLEMKNCNMILTEKQQKYHHYHLAKIDKYEYLAGEEILLPGQKRVIEHAKFIYSPFGKAFQKQIKIMEDPGEKQIKALEEHGKQLAEYNELVKKDFNMNKDSIPLEEQKKYFINLLKKGLPNFGI